MRTRLITCLIVFLLFVPACSLGSENDNAQAMPIDWRTDWAVEEGFTLDVDTEGFEFPSALAFVSNPGKGPKDPLYFVTELRGQVKVVTNDRTIQTFAESFFTPPTYVPLPAIRGQSGMAGICLAPEFGYVYVTYVYQDEDNVLRNNITRFQADPEHFSLEPTARTDFTEVFSGYPTGPAHQIGPCQVKDDMLYVSVGDGFYSPGASQDLATTNGKILRMTLDGMPVPDNPFYEDDDISNPANLILGYGFRNPFGLKLIGNRIFIVENGPTTDRFLEFKEGHNYLWDGTDASIATNASAVFVSSIGPVQLDYLSADRTEFPDYFREKFYVASAGEKPGVLLLDYSLDKSHMLDTAKYIVEYRGQPFTQMVAGLAFGPDGLYFVPIMPNGEERSFVLKLTHDPEAHYPYNTSNISMPPDLLYQKGCFGCHRLGGIGRSIAPALDPQDLVPRLEQRLNSDAYVQSLVDIDLLGTEPQLSFKQARAEVLAAEGLDRVRTWLRYRIQEPRFDNVHAQMPNLEITNQEAELITDFLTAESSIRTRVRGRISNFIDINANFEWLVAAAFFFGITVALVAVGLIYLLRWRRTKST